jgi:hypothetical protein
MSSPAGRGQGPEESRAEQVLSQALRAMAGGEKAGRPDADAAAGRGRRLTTMQLVLLATIIGLLIGAGAGLLTLLI